MKLEKYVEQFKNHVGDAIGSIKKASECYASALREHGNDAQKAFEDAYPHVTPNTWAKFRAVGEGDLNPSAMLLSDKFCAKIARLPKQKQDDALNGDSFTIVNPTTREIEKVNYGRMTPRHERIIFDEAKSKIRTVPEQIAYIDLINAEKRHARKTYTVHTDRLEVHCACNIGKGELEGILEDMQ